jgi:hypothetical protein
VKDVKGKPAVDGGESANRRRVGRVVHDDRGQASVEWHDAPEDYERLKLEIEDGTRAPAPERSRRDEQRPLTLSRDRSFNPYQRVGVDRRVTAPPQSAKRDLRQLSKWIKMMKEIEERKALDRDAPEDDSDSEG